MRLLADSSAWIDYLRGATTASTNLLDDAIQTQDVILGDLILAEIMRGIPDDATASKVSLSLEPYEVVLLGGKALALKGAENFRILRTRGITVRGTVDLLIGTWCIVNDVPLLCDDRDFFGMEDHLGLVRWRDP